MLADPAVSDRPVVPFDISVLLRLSWLDVLDPDSLRSSPTRELMANEFRAVVAADD